MTVGGCHPVVVLEIRGYVEPLIHLRLALVQLVLQTAPRNAAKGSLARHSSNPTTLAITRREEILLHFPAITELESLNVFIIKNIKNRAVRPVTVLTIVETINK